MPKKTSSEDKLLYEYSDCHSEWEPKESQKKGKMNKFARGYIVAIIAIMVGLFIYVAARRAKLGFGIGGTLGGLFPIGVSILILVISLCNGWGKLLRWAIKNPNMAGRDFHLHHADIYKNEFEELDAKKARGENAIRVHENSMAVVFHGEETKLMREDIEYIKVDRYSMIFAINIVRRDGKYVPFSDTIPVIHYSQIVDNLPCEVRVEDYRMGDTQQAATKTRRKSMLPMCLFTMLPCIVGVGLIIASKRGVEIPLFLGIFFLIGGIVATISLFATQSEVIKDGVMPILFGGMFITFVLGLIGFMTSKGGTFLDVFVAMPPMICLVMFIMLGLALILTGIAKIITIARRQGRAKSK